jgi:hypothetical protein
MNNSVIATETAVARIEESLAVLGLAGEPRCHPTGTNIELRSRSGTTGVFAMVDRGGGGGSVFSRRASIGIRPTMEMSFHADCHDGAESSTSRRSVCRPLSPIGESCAVPILISSSNCVALFGRLHQGGDKRQRASSGSIDRSIGSPR